MCSLTCGKYQDVRVSEEYQMQIAPEGNQLYAAEYLSRGTYEQIYFALRLALETAPNRYFWMIFLCPMMTRERSRL